MKAVILTFFLCGIIIFTQAQKTDEGFNIGANINLNTTWILNQNAYEILEVVCPEDGLIGASEPDYKITIGYGAGLSLGYQGKRLLGFATELNYAKGGQNYADSWTINACVLDLSDFKRKFTIHSISIPLMLKLQSRSRRNIKGYGLLGIQPNIVIGVNEQITLSGQAPAANFANASSKVKKFDIGFVWGGGMDYFFTDNMYLNLGLKSYFGFTDINGEVVKGYVSANDVKYQTSRNFNIGIHLGLHVYIEKRNRLY